MLRFLGNVVACVLIGLMGAVGVSISGAPSWAIGMTFWLTAMIAFHGCIANRDG